jgi:hypothetical protein
MIKSHQVSSRDPSANTFTPAGTVLVSDGSGKFSLEQTNTPQAIINEDATFWSSLATSADSIVRDESSPEILAAKAAGKMTLSDILGRGTLDL